MIDSYLHNVDDMGYLRCGIFDLVVGIHDGLELHDRIPNVFERSVREDEIVEDAAKAPDITPGAYLQQ